MKFDCEKYPSQELHLRIRKAFLFFLYLLLCVVYAKAIKFYSVFMFFIMDTFPILYLALRYF